MGTPWYDFPTTQAHGVDGEQGIDIGTPFHTPITEIDPGTVNYAKYGPYGGLVGVATKRGEEYVLHLDEIDVQVGQPLKAGQLVGLSGGQLVGGAHPASSAYSSGPHTEFGIFSGALFGSPALDPTPVIAAARAGQVNSDWSDLLKRSIGLEPISTDAQAALGGLNPLSGIGEGLGQVASSISGLPASIGHGLGDALTAGVDNIGTFFKRQLIALAVAVVVAIVLFGR